MVYRDSTGLTLADYPRPSVAVDTAVLTIAEEGTGFLALSYLQVGRGDGWFSLPGTFLHPGERLSDAVNRSLEQKVGLTGRRPRQLQVFDAPDRDDRGWVLSVAHVDVMPFDALSAVTRRRDDVRLWPVHRKDPLPFDHNEIVRLAVADLRQRYASAPDPDGLLPSRFTLRQLRIVHEIVAGRRLQRDTFRRSVENQLIPTGRMTEGERGRPAELFKKRTRTTR